MAGRIIMIVKEQKHRLAEKSNILARIEP